MMQQLVWVGKALPSRFFIAMSLLLCLSTNGFSASQTRKSVSTTDCSSGNKNKPPCVGESPTGQVTVFWPKFHMSNAISRTVNSKMEVWVDKAKVGMVIGETPLTLSLPNGPHKLELRPFDDYLENIRPTKETQITVSAQKPLYFQILDQGFSITASELDAPTAQAVISGAEPAQQSAPTPQIAVSGSQPKDKPSASPSQATLVSNNANIPSAATPSAAIPSASSTVYLYWPRPNLGLGFLDKYTTDYPVFLDEKRIGVIAGGDFIVVKTTPGEHSIGMNVGLPYGRLLKQDFVVGAGATRHFHVEQQDAFRMFEDDEEEAADHAKGLKQRAVSAQ